MKMPDPVEAAEKWFPVALIILGLIGGQVGLVWGTAHGINWPYGWPLIWIGGMCAFLICLVCFICYSVIFEALGEGK
jgi:hypothetical protein